MKNNDANKKKKSKKSIVLKVFWILYAIYSVINTSFLTDNLITSGFKDKSKIMYIDDNWDVRINDKEYKDVSLDKLKFDTVTKGDEIEIRGTLPDEWIYEDATLCFNTRHAAVEMFIDNKLVYEHGIERIKQNKTVGSGLLFISMFEEYKGKDVRFVLTVDEKNAFSNIDSIWISEWSDSYRYVITENRFAMFIGFFFVIFGMLLAGLGIIAVVTSPKFTDVFLLAVFSMCMGMWTLCYHNCAIVFSLPVYSISLMEHISLLFALLPIILYMKKYVYILDNKTFTNIYKVLRAVQIIFSIIIVIGHAFDFIHIQATLPVFHVLLVVNVFFFATVLSMSLLNSKKEKKASIWSVIAVAVTWLTIIYELVAFLVGRYIGVEMPNIPALATMGIIVLVAMFVMDIWVSLTSLIMEDNEKELLVRRAYTDDLTLINNRRYCSEYMQKIAEKDDEYSVICFDLNGLKKTNDVYGHVKGDMLIQRAAKAISEGFNKSGIVGRMGGDEFIAILRTADEVIIDKLIDNFHDIVERMNDKEEEVPLSVAIGYACSTEVENPHNVEKVYHMADNCMYENKNAMKKARKIVDFKAN